MENEIYYLEQLHISHLRFGSYTGVGSIEYIYIFFSLDIFSRELFIFSIEFLLQTVVITFEDPVLVFVWIK